MLPVLAGEAEPPPAVPPAPPDPAALCAPGTVIGAIDVVCVNVFDTSIPAEDKWVYRAANWVHSINRTRESRVRSLLILRPGEPCDLERLAEAERELRNLPFLSDAWVEPVAREGNEVRVKVRVRDSWSTRIGISAGIAGGAGEASFRIVERNLLGTGVGLGWRYEKDIDRTLRTFDLYAPALTRQRWQVDALYSDNSDGYQRTLVVSRPFYSLDTPWNSVASYDRQRLEQKVYSNGEEVDLWRENYQGAKAIVGWANPRGRDRSVLRWMAGVRQLVEKWERVDPAKPVVVPEIVPPDADAWLVEGGFEWIVPRFVKASYLDSGRRVEDLDLSTHVLLSAGRSVAGPSESRAFELEATASTGFAFGEKNTLLIQVAQLVRMSGGDWYDVITTLGRPVLPQARAAPHDLPLLHGVSRRRPPQHLAVPARRRHRAARLRRPPVRRRPDVAAAGRAPDLPDAASGCAWSGWPSSASSTSGRPGARRNGSPGAISGPTRGSACGSPCCAGPRGRGWPPMPGTP